MLQHSGQIPTSWFLHRCTHQADIKIYNFIIVICHDDDASIEESGNVPRNEGPQLQKPNFQVLIKHSVSTAHSGASLCLFCQWFPQLCLRGPSLLRLVLLKLSTESTISRACSQHTLSRTERLPSTKFQSKTLRIDSELCRVGRKFP